MRVLPLIALLALPLAACQTNPDAAVAEETAAQPAASVQTAGYALFGENVDTTEAVGAAVVTAAPASYAGKTVTVEGEVKQVCQAAGCWATIQTASGAIRIKTPHKEGGGYEWTLPKDITGRRVVATGTLAQAASRVDGSARATTRTIAGSVRKRLKTRRRKARRAWMLTRARRPSRPGRRRKTSKSNRYGRWPTS